MGFVERERMQNVGEQQFLVLLLVIETDLDDRDQRSIFRRLDQRGHGGIDVRAVFGNFGGVGPGDQPALRARLPRPHCDVIGIEEIGEPLVERLVVRANGRSMNCSKNQVACARCHLVGLVSGIDWTTWSSGDNSAARRSVSPRTA